MNDDDTMSRFSGSDFDAGSQAGSRLHFGSRNTDRSRRMSGLMKLKNKLKTKHAFWRAETIYKSIDKAI